MWAEYQLQLGLSTNNLNERIYHLQEARLTYPFQYFNRVVLAIEFSRLAINNNSVEYGKIALPELNNVLKSDLYSPEVLAPAAVINFGLGNTKEAQQYYSLFKQTAKRSSYLDFMKGQ